MATTSNKEPPNLYQRLLAITAEAHVAKSGKAAAQMGGFAYHKIDDVDEVLGKLFAKHGVHRSITVTSMETQIVPAKDGKSDYVSTATIDITYTNADKFEETLTVQSFGRGIDRADKSEGKAISYASKNHSLSFFCMRGQPDNEAEAHENHTPQERDYPQASPSDKRFATGPQRKRLFAIAKESGWTADEMKPWIESKWGYDHTDQITRSDYDSIVDFFETHSPKTAIEERDEEELDKAIKGGAVPEQEEVPF